MGFSVKIEGQIVDSEQAQVEQKEGLISDALRGVLAQFSNDITLVVATFDYAGELDLTPTSSEPPATGGGTPPPDGTFHNKVAGESFLNYGERLIAYNQANPDHQIPADQQYGPDREAEWDGLPVG